MCRVTKATQPVLIPTARVLPKRRFGQPFEVEGRRWKTRKAIHDAAVRAQEALEGPLDPKVVEIITGRLKHL